MSEQITRQLTTHNDYAESLIELLAHARQQVAIFTPDLSPLVYDRPALIEAARDFALNTRFGQLRILVRHPDSVVKEGRRLLELTQRLSSKIVLRALQPDFRDREEAFATADDQIYTLRRQSSIWDGLYDHSRPAVARQLRGTFDEMWKHSSPDPGFRRLHI